MDNCNCPDQEPDPHAKHSAWRQISMDCPIHGEPTQDQLAARIRELEAENKELREGRGVTPDDRCAKCGAPRSNHPYRHPFESRAALRALSEGEG